MIDRFDPFGRALSLRQVMDRMLEDAFIMPRAGGTQAVAESTMSMDMYEQGDNYVVEAQLPGIKPEDIQVNIEQGTLTIRAETKTEQERRERNYLIREHRAGRFSRSVRLPESVDADACQARYENGVLRLTIPKAEQAKPRRIQVQAERSGGTMIEGRTAQSVPSETKPAGQSSRGRRRQSQ